MHRASERVLVDASIEERVRRLQGVRMQLLSSSRRGRGRVVEESEDWDREGETRMRIRWRWRDGQIINTPRLSCWRGRSGRRNKCRQRLARSNYAGANHVLLIQWPHSIAPKRIALEGRDPVNVMAEGPPIRGTGARTARRPANTGLSASPQVRLTAASPVLLAQAVAAGAWGALGKPLRSVPRGLL